MAESDLAPAATQYLRDLGCDVYHEVVFFGKRADLVGLRRSREGATIVHVVELKTSLGFAVFDQAIDWHGLAHFVAVGAPQGKMYGAGRTCRDLADRWGIGVLRLSQSKYEPYNQECAPRLHRCVRPEYVERWVAACVPQIAADQATVTAGSKGGGYWTPFRATLNEIERYLQDSQHPERRDGVLLKVLVDGIRHHYANSQSARGALAKWLDRGQLPGVETFVRAGKLCVRLTK